MVKKKISFIYKIKNYFTAKPKSDFWMWAFITLFLFRWVSPSVILMQVPFRIGLLGIKTDYLPIAQNMTQNFIKPMERLQEAGLNIYNNNPLTARVLFEGLGYFTWIIWVAMLFLAINLVRYVISYIYRKVKKKEVKD